MYTLCQKTLLKACLCVGSQAELARRLHITRTRLNNWINRGDKVTYHYVVAIERVTGKAISRHELAPALRRMKPTRAENRGETVSSDQLHDRVLQLESLFYQKIHTIEQQLLALSKGVSSSNEVC